MPKYKLKDLMEEEWETGGITLWCDCGAEFFVEPDNTAFCEDCKKKVRNPLMDGGFI